MSSKPRRFREVMELWTCAVLSDQQFIKEAERVGCGELARSIIQRDLDTP